jgi:hypothetical protein
MKRVLAFAVMFAVTTSGLALAQSGQAPPSLADVARAEEARRKTTKKATMVLTNGNLSPGDVSAQPSTTAPAAGAANATPSKTPPAASTTLPGGKAEPIDKAAMKDQAYWQGRISQARTELSRTQMFAESLQTRINSLKTDFVNRDNRVEREKIQQDLNTSLAELERLKKEIDKQTKAITAIEDEARRANVPAGWLRPSA